MRLPVKGVSSGSGWLANRGMSVKEGNSFPLVCVFSGSFGVQSIVLCKCSGNVLIIQILSRATKRKVTPEQNAKKENNEVNHSQRQRIL